MAIQPRINDIPAHRLLDNIEVIWYFLFGNGILKVVMTVPPIGKQRILATYLPGQCKRALASLSSQTHASAVHSGETALAIKSRTRSRLALTSSFLSSSQDPPTLSRRQGLV